MKSLLALLILFSFQSHAASLNESAASGDLATLKKSVKTKKDANTKNADGESLLESAAAAGDLNIVGFLLKKGADINARDNAGETALLQAVSGAQDDVAIALIERGANLTLTYDEKKQNILFEAVRIGHLPVIKAIAKRRPALLQDKDDNGDTALFEAVRATQSEAASLLIKMGAKKNAVNKAGKKPIDLTNPKLDQKLIEILK